MGLTLATSTGLVDTILVRHRTPSKPMPRGFQRFTAHADWHQHARSAADNQPFDDAHRNRAFRPPSIPMAMLLCQPFLGTIDSTHNVLDVCMHADMPISHGRRVVRQKSRTLVRPTTMPSVSWLLSVLERTLILSVRLESRLFQSALTIVTMN